MVAEIALALVLLVGAALLVRTAVALRDVEPGFDATSVLTMRMSMSGERYLKSEGRRADGARRRRAHPRHARRRERPAPRAACRSRAATACRFVIVGRPLTDGP